MPTTTRREVKWNLILQYSGIGFMLVQGVLLVPIYLRQVGSAEFGLWLVAGSVAMWLGIIDPGISALMQQRVARALGGDRPGRAVGLARRGLWLNAGLAALMLAAGALSAGWFARLIDPGSVVAPRTGSWLVFLTVATVAAGLVANGLTSLGAGLRAARAHTLVAIVSAAAGIAATLGGLAAGWGVLALPGGGVVRGVLQSLLAWPLVQRDLGRLGEAGDDTGAIENQELDGRALAWAAFEKLTGAMAMSADVFFIGRAFEPATVTAYALTKRPVDLLLNFFQRPAVALTPTVSYLSGAGRAAEAGTFVAAVVTRMLWLLGAAALGTVLWLELLVGFWFGAAQYLGDSAVGLLAAGLAVNVLSGLFANLHFASGATTSYYAINGALSLVALPCMIVGLKISGVVGLMVGALLPRAAVALWLFPSLALRALRVAASERHAMGTEMLGTLVAVGAGLALVWIGPATAWIRGCAGMAVYGIVLVVVSGRLRATLSGFFAKRAG